MKTLSKLINIFIMAGALALLYSCVNIQAEDKTNPVVSAKQTSMDEFMELQPTEPAAVKNKLNEAKAAGKAVFVVVTGTGITNADEALDIAKRANDIYKNAAVIVMNRDDAANSQLVNKWRLSGAPLPLILVVSPKGLLTGGRILAQATAENIASLVPSPNLEKVYDAIGNKKIAIVAFTKKTFQDRLDVLKECNEAAIALNNEAVVIEVDMDNQLEKGFMEQVRINPVTAKASITLVINTQGQVAGTSTTVPDSEKLVAAAKTPVKSGCGPGCGPAGCEK